MDANDMDGEGPRLLRERFLNTTVAPELVPRFRFAVNNRWELQPERGFQDGFVGLTQQVDRYSRLRLPGNETVGDHLAAMPDNDRAEMAMVVARMGVTYAVLSRDFPDADKTAIDTVTRLYKARRKGRAPTSRQSFRSIAKSAQAICFLDCFVRRRCFEKFEAALFLDAFKRALSAYELLSAGFEETLTPAEAWAILESALSGALELDVCQLSGQPFFAHADLPGCRRSPFPRFRGNTPSVADRALMELIDWHATK